MDNLQEVQRKLQKIIDKNIKTDYSILYNLLLLYSLIMYGYLKYPMEIDKISNVQNSLITTSGIIAGVVIAYLSAKIFSINTIRSNVRKDLVVYSKKLTAFRKLVYYVYKSRNFWVKYDGIMQFRKDFPNLNSLILDDDSIENDDKENFFKLASEGKYLLNSITLYLAIEMIVNDNNKYLYPSLY